MKRQKNFKSCIIPALGALGYLAKDNNMTQLLKNDWAIIDIAVPRSREFQVAVDQMYEDTEIFLNKLWAAYEATKADK